MGEKQQNKQEEQCKREKQEKQDKRLTTFVKGMITGATMLVPGVSGGSMAMILGVYDRLIRSVSSFLKHKRESIFFLMFFALGGGLGMFLFATPLSRLIAAFPGPMLYFFTGTVVGGIPLIWKRARIQKIAFKHVIYIFIGMVFVWSMTLLPTGFFRTELHGGLKGTLLLLFAGLVAAVAFVLPGISVSYLLLVMGLYDETIRSISELYFPFLLPLGFGLFIGILLTTRILETAMKIYPNMTYLMILGFVLGSLTEVFPGIPSSGQIAACILMFVAGFAAIWMLSVRERMEKTED